MFFYFGNRVLICRFRTKFNALVCVGGRVWLVDQNNVFVIMHSEFDINFHENKNKTHAEVFSPKVNLDNFYCAPSRTAPAATSVKSFRVNEEFFNVLVTRSGTSNIIIQEVIFFFKYQTTYIIILDVSDYVSSTLKKFFEK